MYGSFIALIMASKPIVQMITKIATDKLTEGKRCRIQSSRRVPFLFSIAWKKKGNDDNTDMSNRQPGINRFLKFGSPKAAAQLFLI